MTRIILECKPDEALVRALGVPKKEIIHQSSKGEVINFLRRNSNCFGIVDEDPGAGIQDYFKKFSIIKERSDVVFLKEEKQGNHLIVIRPRLEEWLISQANLVSIKTSDFSLPIKGSQLHKVINSKLERVQELVLELESKKSDGILFLKKTISSF